MSCARGKPAASRRLSIAMLAAHSCPLGRPGSKDTGGMNVYVRELAKELGKRGHLVDVYTRAHDSADEQVVDLGDNARLIHIRAGDEGELDKLAIYPHLPDFACELQGFSQQHQRRYDLVFSHYWLSAWVGEHLQVRWHVPHVAMFHTLGAAKNAAGFGEVNAELRMNTERDLVKSCRHIIAATTREKQDLISYYGAAADTVKVVPCGVNLDMFRPADKGKAKQALGLTGNNVVLFVGRIEPLKGIDKLVRAMAYLRDGPVPQLLIIGGDEHSQPEVEKLRRLSAELGIEDFVSFVGMVEQEELPLFYNAADVCVIPSYYETFGMVILESLACGTPVVSTDVGTAGNVIRQGMTGYVVEDNSPPLLAQKIALVLSGRGIPGQDTIRASVIKFSWANIAARILGEWQDVVRPLPAPSCVSRSDVIQSERKGVLNCLGRR